MNPLDCVWCTLPARELSYSCGQFTKFDRFCQVNLVVKYMLQEQSNKRYALNLTTP